MRRSLRGTFFRREAYNWRWLQRRLATDDAINVYIINTVVMGFQIYNWRWLQRRLATDDAINVYIINTVVMGFQIYI